MTWSGGRGGYDTLSPLKSAIEKEYGSLYYYKYSKTLLDSHLINETKLYVYCGPIGFTIVKKS